MSCEICSDAELNTRVLYTFTISSLMDVSATWHKLHHRLPLRCSQMFLASSTSSIIYSGAEASSANWPSPSAAPSNSWLSVWRRVPGRGDTGRREDRRDRTSRDARLWRVPRTFVQYSEALHSHRTSYCISRVAICLFFSIPCMTNKASSFSHSKLSPFMTIVSSCSH